MEACLAGAVGEVDVEFAAFQVHFFGIVFQGEQRGVRCSWWPSGKKCHEHLAWVQIAVGGKRGGCDSGSQFIRCAEDDFHAESEGTLDPILNFPGQRGRIFRIVREFGAEDDVAALNEGARIVELEGFVKDAQGVHLNAVVADHVDAAEHGDQYRHDRGSIAFAARVRLVALLSIANQENHFDGVRCSSRIGESTGRRLRGVCFDHFVGTLNP